MWLSLLSIFELMKIMKLKHFVHLCIVFLDGTVSKFLASLPLIEGSNLVYMDNGFTKDLI